MNTDHLQEQKQVTVSGHLEDKRGIYQMCLSWMDLDGKRGRKGKSTRLPVKGNKKRAEAMLREFIQQMENELNQHPNIPAASNQILFADYMLHWLEIAKDSGIKKTTYGGYWMNVHKTIVPYFREKQIYLQELTAEDITQFYQEELKRVKATSVHKYHANISKAMKQAVKEGLIGHSIMDKVERPKKERYIGKFLKQSEVVRLFDVVKGHKLELGILLGAFYGLRRGEIVGLRWDAIDFEANTITIEHTVTVTNEEGKTVIIEDDTTKSTTSYRTLPLIPQFRAKLLELKEEQQKNKKLCGNSYCKKHEGYIYVDALGRRIHPNYLTDAFPAFMVQNGFRRLRFHDLRHSSASLLLANGVSLKAIQEWLGHADFAITANLYAHLEFESKLASANAMTWINQTNI